MLTQPGESQAVCTHAIKENLAILLARAKSEGYD